MRLPSGGAPTPWLTSIPEITPTTLFVAGSITWTLSPALLVWMIRTLLCWAAAGIVQRTIAATTARYRRSVRMFVIVVNSSTPLTTALRSLSKHKGFQCLPLGIVLRAEMLAAIVEEVSASLFLERMEEKLALQEAGPGHPLDSLEVLA